LALPCVGTAQEQASNSAAAEKPDAATTKKAFDLLDTVAGQLPNLHTPANRIHVECAIADLLWVHDEKRARTLFKTVSEEMTALIGAIDFGDQYAYQELSLINQQRQEIVQRIAQHDPELALTFLRETRLQQAATNSQSNWYAQNETNMELNLAAQIAARNPARALQLARASLSKGVSYGLVGLLSQLQQKDQKTAQTLYKEIVEQIKNEDLAQNPESTNVAWNLLGSFQPPQANEDTYRDLMDTLTNAALAIVPGNQSSNNLALSVSNQLQSYLPQIEKYAPARVGPLRQWSQSVELTLDPNARMYREIGEISQSGNADDMVVLAQKYPPALRDQIYQQAAWKAFSNGDTNRARQIASEMISDPMQRRQMLDQFDNQAINNAASENKIAEVRQLLSKVNAVDRKIQTLIQLAGNLLNKGDKKGALDVLNEARTLAASSPPNSSLMAAQLQLAGAYASLDLDQSFAIMRPLIAKANELIAAAAVLDGYENRYLKEGEWMTPGSSNLSNLLGNLDQTLANLGRLDFDRARSLADQLERPEVRMMAQLQIAQYAINNNIANLPVMNRRVIMSID